MVNSVTNPVELGACEARRSRGPARGDAAMELLHPKPPRNGRAQIDCFGAGCQIALDMTTIQPSIYIERRFSEAHNRTRGKCSIPNPQASVPPSHCNFQDSLWLAQVCLSSLTLSSTMATGDVLQREVIAEDEKQPSHETKTQSSSAIVDFTTSYFACSCSTAQRGSTNS